MDKSVYSLVLMDDVVREIDRIARQTGTSRSGLINEWLAERVSLLTPERFRQEVWRGARQCFEGQEAIHVLPLPRGGQIVVRSVLCCSYSPALHYTVTLGGEAPELGELRVSTRSQREELLAAVHGFFELWARLETTYIAHRLRHPMTYRISPGQYRRRLARPERENWPARQQGEAIAAYIHRFDRLLKLYFTHLDDPELADRVEKVYARMIGEAEEIL